MAGGESTERVWILSFAGREPGEDGPSYLFRVKHSKNGHKTHKTMAYSWEEVMDDPALRGVLSSFCESKRDEPLMQARSCAYFSASAKGAVRILKKHDNAHDLMQFLRAETADDDDEEEQEGDAEETASSPISYPEIISSEEKKEKKSGDDAPRISFPLEKAKEGQAFIFKFVGGKWTFYQAVRVDDKEDGDHGSENLLLDKEEEKKNNSGEDLVTEDGSRTVEECADTEKKHGAPPSDEDEAQRVIQTFSALTDTSLAEHSSSFASASASSSSVSEKDLTSDAIAAKASETEPLTPFDVDRFFDEATMDTLEDKEKHGEALAVLKNDLFALVENRGCSQTEEQASAEMQEKQAPETPRKFRTKTRGKRKNADHNSGSAKNALLASRRGERKRRAPNRLSP